MRTDGETSAPLEFGLIFLLAALWGLPYALTKLSLATIPPITGVAGRVAVAAVVLWAVAIALGRKIPRDIGFAKDAMVQGCLACVIPYTLIAFGQLYVDSALAAILNSTTPLFVCVLSLTLTRHEPVTTGRLTGVAIGLGGVVMIVGMGALAGLGHERAGQAAIMLATVSSAFSVIYGRRFARIAPEVTAAAMLTCAAVVLLPLCAILESPWRTTPSLASLAALLANAVIATALGFVVYFRLIRTIGSIGTASASYLKPAVGVLIGCMALGEELTWIALTGLLVIIVGVAVINIGNPVAPLRGVIKQQSPAVIRRPAP